MSKSAEQSKSLVDEIYEEFLESLKKTGEFDDKLLTQLAALIQNGDIRKYQQVAKLLKSTGDGKK